MEADAQVSNLGDQIGIWCHSPRSRQPLQEERQRWVVDSKCLWVLRREVWAVALGLRDGGGW